MKKIFLIIIFLNFLTINSFAQSSLNDVYGPGDAFACYIKNRKNPDMPGWTMMWKAERALKESCTNKLDACAKLLKEYNGEKFCCIHQALNVDITVTDVDTANNKCVTA